MIFIHIYWSTDQHKKMSMVSHIVAYRVSDRGIGYKNDLLYRFKEDMQHFKTLTMHHIVLMGRKTFESIGNKPLSNRINVVLSKTLESSVVQTFSDISVAMEWCHKMHPEKHVFVIGGESIYRQTIPYIQKVYATEIEDTEQNTPADTFYPHIEAKCSNVLYKYPCLTIKCYDL